MWKVVVLIAGLVGVAGFFLPLRTLASDDGRITAHRSAYEIVGGIDASQALVAQLGAAADAPAFAREASHALETYRYTMIALFAPSVLLVVVGLAGIARGRAGRIAGISAIVFGLASVAAFLGLLALAGDLVVHDERIVLRLSSTIGAGMYALAIAGVVGAIAGFAALVRRRPRAIVAARTVTS